MDDLSDLIEQTALCHNCQQECSHLSSICDDCEWEEYFRIVDERDTIISE